MKFLLPIISIALLIQLSIAGPVRSKRADAFVDFVEVTAKILKEFVPASEVSVKNALTKIPKTDAYAEYTKKLEGYLEKLHSKESTKEICFKKSIDLVENFFAFVEEYSKVDASAEAKEVYKYLEENEDPELTKKVDQWKIKFADFLLQYSDKDGNDIKDIGSEDALKFLEIILEVC